MTEATNCWQDRRRGRLGWRHRSLKESTEVRGLDQRGIGVGEVRRVLTNGETIERYPADQPYPSRLVLGIDRRPIHIVVAYNSEYDYHDNSLGNRSSVLGCHVSKKGAAMKCVTWKHGETREGTTTVTLARGSMSLVFRGVPAQVCDTCGEEYVDEATTARLLGVAEEAAAAGVQVEVREYVAT